MSYTKHKSNRLEMKANMLLRRFKSSKPATKPKVRSKVKVGGTIQKQETISNLNKMLFHKKITQEYYNKKISMLQ